MKVLLTFAQVTAKNGTDISTILVAILGWIQGGIMGEAALSYSLASLAVFIGLDWLTGIRASRYEGKPIESAKLGRTSDKLIGYAIGIVVVGLLCREIEPIKSSGSMLVTALVWYFMAVEAWSILENLDRMRVRLPRWMKRRIGEALKKLDAGDEKEG